ncbi:MAG: DUF2202 domain-containing protein [Saprospiraceae bacterium]|nr:DUF2202 domain-containing protein [Saprospiraceae bacterium]HPG08683.1 DUF2202 domain-containing protein [Saprospiraceae bacterium]HQU53814.1 DUF2202 domain-containing protein [Saprospiraceae bacterium]
MKTPTFKMILPLLTFLFFAIGCQKETTEPQNQINQNRGLLENLVYQLPEEPLSPAEIQGLNWMREEEKLARDVYAISNGYWNRQVFAHITSSEQSHMDGIGYLLEKYDLPDPITSDETGVFADQVLQSLFDSLKIASSQSVIAALETGAWIEELDILDLDVQIELADNQDILLVYENLQKGSRNHLRAFVRNLDMEGVTYQPQLLSEERYLAIINSEQETGLD